MANFNLPNLCGANTKFNGVQTKMDDLKKKLLSNITAPASSLSLSMKSELVNLDLNLSLLMTKKPTLSNISLQVEIKDLVSLTVGSVGYNAKVVAIAAKFGPALAKKNLDIVKLAAAAALLIVGKKDICDLVPNLEIPAAGGDVIEMAKNITQPDQDSDLELPSTIVNPVLALDAANIKMVERLTEASKQFDAIVPKLTVGAGSTGRVGADVRQAFREADVRIASAMTAAGFSTSPTDSRLADIKTSDVSLADAVGTSKVWINPDAAAEKFEQELDTSSLDTLASNFRDVLAKATKPYPENLDVTGSKVFFPPSNLETLKETYNKAVKVKNAHVSALLANQTDILSDTSNPMVKTFKSDMVVLENKMKTLISDFESNSVRPVDIIDKTIESDIVIVSKSLPKIEDFGFS